MVTFAALLSLLIISLTCSAALRSPSESFQTPSSLQDAQEVPLFPSTHFEHVYLTSQAQSRQSRNPSNPSSIEQNLPFRDSNSQTLPQSGPGAQTNATPQLQQTNHFESPMVMNEHGPTASQQQAHQQQVSEMSESEKYGLPGLVAQLQNNTFFQGQELTALEIDLEKSVHTYLLHLFCLADQQ